MNIYTYYSFDYHKTFDNETFLFTQDNTNQAIKLLQENFDGSAVNYHSRQRAKKYLSGLKKSLQEFKNKKPESKCAAHLQQMIKFYAELEG